MSIINNFYLFIYCMNIINLKDLPNNSIYVETIHTELL